MNQLKIKGTYTMHKNSLESYYDDKSAGKHQTRAHAIIELMTDERQRTDRRIMTALGFTDMNAVRPRISELIIAGTLVEVGDIKDFVTGKKVRTVKLASNI